MKTGEIAEIAIWLNGEETEEHLRRWKEEEIPAIMKKTEDNYKVRLGPVRFFELQPGQDRVPPVPPSIQGLDVRLLIAEADVIARKKVSEAKAANTFVNDLTKSDLGRLRSITRRAHFKARGIRLTDKECDAVIDHLGIEIALRNLRGEAIN